MVNSFPPCAADDSPFKLSGTQPPFTIYHSPNNASFQDTHWPGRAAGQAERGHGSDNPEAVLEARGADGVRGVSVLRLALPRRRKPRAFVRAERAEVRGRERSGRGAKLRLRLFARARAVGSVGVRLPRRRRGVVW